MGAGAAPEDGLDIGKERYECQRDGERAEYILVHHQL